MSEREWHKSPAPHIGWWNASTAQDPTAWRWWDGVGWSRATWPYDSHRAVLSAAKAAVGRSLLIEWTDYYPKNARVPRIDPRQ